MLNGATKAWRDQIRLVRVLTVCGARLTGRRRVAAMTCVLKQWVHSCKVWKREGQLLRMAALKFMGISIVPMLRAWRRLVEQHQKMRRVARNLGFSSQASMMGLTLEAWQQLVLTRRAAAAEQERRDQLVREHARAHQAVERVLLRIRWVLAVWWCGVPVVAVSSFD